MTDVAETEAQLNGELVQLVDASSADVGFEYRQTGASAWTATPTQTLSSTQTYDDLVSGLDSNTDYEMRAVGDVASVTDTGGVVSWTTEIAEPNSGVSRWEFEQDVTDSWGSYDGTNNGASFTADSQVGSYALDFDGSGDYVDFGPIPETQGVSELSVSVWIKWNALGSKKHVIGLYPDFDNGVFIGSDQSNGKNYRVRVENGGNRTQLLDNGVGSSTGTWYHLAMTFNSGSLTFYIDGSQVGSDSGGPSNTPSLDDWHIGGSTERGEYSDSVIDDARIYDRELSSTEVSNLYNTGSING